MTRDQLIAHMYDDHHMSTFWEYELDWETTVLRDEHDNLHDVVKCNHRHGPVA